MMNDRVWMMRCLELAQLGGGLVSPNPMVGSVIVADGHIIGEGYHHRYGGPHAEVEAIRSVHRIDLLRKSTLYVNLEPCSHHGKTPPCSDLIIETGIPRVVIGCMDTNPKVAGRGVKRLQDAGVEVITGIAESESRWLNRAFFTYHGQKRPYIILKWAETEDGFIDVLRETGGDPVINWITDARLRLLVHRWRDESDAILVGAGTVRNDNPELTTREWPGKNPLRIVMDPDGSLNPHPYKVFSPEAPTWLYSTNLQLRPEAVVVMDGSGPRKDLLLRMCSALYDHQVLTLLVEGGQQMLESMINAGLWDEARVFTGAKRFVNGLKAPVIHSIHRESVSFGSDLLRLFINPTSPFA
jgi:diaminohydroxyphosphoribosylaminopyrimidine deaminase / 5-amino-6-(5-phosphoribosylamino)uracil reductase